jgi:hypothetical protein
MMTTKTREPLFDFDTPPTLKELVFSLIGFAVTVTFALIEDWKAADIVWAAWLSSLLVGLSFFFVMTFKIIRDKAKGIHLKEEEGSGPGCLGSASMAFMGLLAWLSGPGVVRIVLICIIVLDLFGIIANILAKKRILGLNPELPVIRVLLFIPTALFIFLFFLGHFGGFHAGHAFILGLLVPLELEIPGMIDSLAGVRSVFFSFFKVLFLTYWPYVISVAAASFRSYRKALASSKKDYMIGPYKNVIRIHILIFILAPIAMAGLGKVVTIIVLFFFYFPVERTVAWFRKRK